MTEIKKKCTGCGGEMILSEFHKKVSGRLGRAARCKTCSNGLQRIKLKEIRAINSLNPSVGIEDKICAGCGIEKSRTAFTVNLSAQDGLQGHCKECKAESQRLYAKGHRESMREHSRQYRIDNAESLAAKRKVKYVLNRDAVLENAAIAYSKADKRALRRVQSLREKARMKSDPSFRLIRLLRSRVRQFIKGGSKSESTMGLLGCTADEFRDYFESKFTKGMTWDLVMDGKIHIDHTIPLWAFDVANPVHQKVAIHWSNCAPLWASDNLHKSRSVPENFNISEYIEHQLDTYINPVSFIMES